MYEERILPFSLSRAYCGNCMFVNAARFSGHILWRLFHLSVTRVCSLCRGDNYVGDNDEPLERRVVCSMGCERTDVSSDVATCVGYQQTQ